MLSRGMRAAVAAGVAAGASLVLLFLGGTGGVRVGAAHAATGSAAGAKVTFTGKTVIIPRKLVKRLLIGISKNHRVFKFKRAEGPLRKLRRGKVMLLQGADALVVTRVSHRRGKLIVSARGATLRDVIKRGRIQVSTVPDMRRAIKIYPVNPISNKAASDGGMNSKVANEFERPSYPYVDSARPADGGLTLAGSSGAYGFNITITPASKTRLNFSGTLCFQKGSVCSNGTANILAAEINFGGFFESSKVESGMTVDGGALSQLSYKLLGLKARANYTYLVSRGTGGQGTPDPPVLHVPVGVGIPIQAGFVPLYIRVQFGLLLKLGVTSKNAVIRGGTTSDTSGSTTVSEKNNTVADSNSGASGSAAVQSGPSISPAAAGVVVALQAPKIGLGLGVEGANGIAYVDFIGSVGQTVGSAIAGQFCSRYDYYYSLGGGFELQAGPILFGTPRKILWPTNGQQGEKHLRQPGC